MKTVQCRSVLFLCLLFLLPLTCFSPLEQMSVTSLVPAVFLEQLPWHLLCALCAKARSLSFARRTTTAKHPTASPSTTAREPSGQTKQNIVAECYMLCAMLCIYSIKNNNESYLFFHRCLKSGAGDVAFVDHLVLESIDGKQFSNRAISIVFKIR